MTETARTRPSVLAFGRGWVAIDKPAGMSVHNDPDSRADAISCTSDLLIADAHLREKTGWAGPSGGFAVSPVHRLDRETSGVLVLATRSETARVLQARFGPELVERSLKKIYRAVVRGEIKPDRRQGEWTFTLTDRAEGRAQPAGKREARKPCRTEYRALRSNKYLTEIEIDLLTGRQHQIRRHAALAGHHVVGDPRYGDPSHATRTEKLFGFSRLMLHAHRLEMTPPGDHGPVVIEAPLPLEFERIFRDVRNQE